MHRLILRQLLVPAAQLGKQLSANDLHSMRAPRRQRCTCQEAKW